MNVPFVAFFRILYHWLQRYSSAFRPVCFLPSCYEPALRDIPQLRNVVFNDLDFSRIPSTIQTHHAAATAPLGRPLQIEPLLNFCVCNHHWVYHRILHTRFSGGVYPTLSFPGFASPGTTIPLAIRARGKLNMYIALIFLFILSQQHQQSGATVRRHDLQVQRCSFIGYHRRLWGEQTVNADFSLTVQGTVRSQKGIATRQAKLALLAAS